jgi:hypothetical protein
MSIHKRISQYISTEKIELSTHKNLQFLREVCFCKKLNLSCKGFRAYFRSLELGFRSLSIIPRVRLLASFSCLCSEGFIFPISGSHTVTSSFDEAIGDGNKKFAPDSYMSDKKFQNMYRIWATILTTSFAPCLNEQKCNLMWFKKSSWKSQVSTTSPRPAYLISIYWTSIFSIV